LTNTFCGAILCSDEHAEWSSRINEKEDRKMKVKRERAGWYYITLNDGRKFWLAQTGGTEYPWNLHSWSEYFKCYDLCGYECFKTKKEAIEQLKYEEK
jgi:hypothetical protein